MVFLLYHFQSGWISFLYPESRSPGQRPAFCMESVPLECCVALDGEHHGGNPCRSQGVASALSSPSQGALACPPWLALFPVWAACYLTYSFMKFSTHISGFCSYCSLQSVLSFFPPHIRDALLPNDNLTLSVQFLPFAYSINLQASPKSCFFLNI